MSLASQPHWSGQQPSQQININSFGAFLRYLRESIPLSQRDLTATFPAYFEEYRASKFLLSADMYRKMEKGRAAQYEELLPLFAALVGCGCKPTLQDCRTYVRLARQKLESLRTRRPKLRPEGEWRMLETRLFQLARSAGAKEEPEPQLKERLHPRSFSFDISHLVGREEWLSTMLSHAQKRKKLVVISGLMGVGKTSGLKLLLSHFLERRDCYPLLYTFPSAEDAKPADHLQAWLATVLAELDASEPETTKIVPLETLGKQVLTRIAQLEQRVVLLLDDAQHALDSRGHLSAEWKQFLSTYLGADHQALIYLAAREWPLWTGRNRSFVIDGDDAVLPTLGEQACLQIWENVGFGDVPEALLAQASKKYGSNPLMIELRAASMARPRFPYGWGNQRKKAETGASAKSEHHLLVEDLLEEVEVFSTADVEATALLEQVISQRLSQEALELLDVLAASPLALPFPLLAEINGTAEYAFFMELHNASLLDRTTMNADGRASLQPLAREAGRQKLLAERRLEGVEEQLIHLYEAWLLAPDFLSDQEQSEVVTELLVLLFKHHALLQAAELVVRFGWLSTLFGQIPRLLRLYEQALRDFNWRATPESEAGAILLRYQLLQRSGQKVDDQEQYRDYCKVHTFLVEQLIRLHPSTQVHLAHHLMLIPMRASHFAEALAILEETFTRIAIDHAFRAEDHASFLYSKARLLARWGEAEEKLVHSVESERLRSECIAVLAESIILWKDCQFGALPLERRYVDFRLARSLNDYAYRLRLHGLLEEAEHALCDCLVLKKAGAALPKSLAISLSEYSQILLSRGRFQEALVQSDQALQIVEDLIQSGNRAARADKGMFLVERAEIYICRGYLEEAERSLLEGRDLTAERAARKSSHNLAIQRLAWIASQKQNQVGGLYQIDRPTWFERYLTLAAYDDLDWLLQAGPFTSEEQREWDRLFGPEQAEETRDQLSKLLVQSRQREFAQCVEEEREPCLRYPKIPVDEIQARLEGFSRLKSDIEMTEANVVVRRLYIEAVEEQLCFLRLFAAIAAGNIDEIKRQNLALYGLPSIEEMSIALQVLFSMLEKACGHALAAPIAEQIALQCKRWHLFAGDFMKAILPLPTLPDREGVAKQELREFSARTVQRFFQRTLREADIEVVIEPARGNTYIDVSVGRLALPDRPFRTEKIRQLLAEEIETHAYRGLCGRKSPLALLFSGLSGYHPTEEGLAKKYIEQVNGQIYGKPSRNTWPGTLATGLMSGVVTPALSFRQICTFLEQVFFVRYLLEAKYTTMEEARKAASQDAWKRASRTARGVTDLSVPGICSLKDRIYLQGYLNVSRFLESGGDLQRLYVGKVGIQHIELLQELSILQPSLSRQQLALDPDLQDRLIALEEA
jgi:hypothetical protein